MGRRLKDRFWYQHRICFDLRGVGGLIKLVFWILVALVVIGAIT